MTATRPDWLTVEHCRDSLAVVTLLGLVAVGFFWVMGRVVAVVRWAAS